jgi:cell division protein FtsL
LSEARNNGSFLFLFLFLVCSASVVIKTNHRRQGLRLEV